MSSLNKVYLIGNLTRDPEIRHTAKGMAVSDLSMAINSTYKAQDGTEREETVFLDVVTWGRQAETCGQYLSKGSPVFVEGRLQLDQWEDKDGQKKSRIKVRAERVQFLGRSGRSDSRDTQSAPSQPRPSSAQGDYSPRPQSAHQADEPPHHAGADYEDDHPF